MGTYITDTGFKGKTLQEIRQELTEALRNVFGPSFETSVDSPNGQLIGQLALALANLWQLGQEVHSSMDPAQATGVALDILAKLSNTTRHSATPARVTAMLYSEDADPVTIPAGSVARRTRGSLDFTLDSAVTITPTGYGCNEVKFSADGGSIGGSSSLMVYAGTAQVVGGVFTQATAYARLQAFASQLAASEYDFDIRWEGETLVVGYFDGRGKTGANSEPDGFSVVGGTLGNFTAVTPGPEAVNIGELDRVVSDVDGWAGVYNLDPGIPGTAVETDSSLRIRREASARTSQAKGTEEAIENHLKADVEGVTDARVDSNRTMTTDDQGRPPKSFEALVAGGTDEDVAMNIWENQAAGIESYGNTEVTITDSHGDEQVVKFSRPHEKILWLRITLTPYTEQQYGGDDTVRQAVDAWSRANMTLGHDVIPELFKSPIYRVPGISLAEVEVALTETASDTPSYVSTIIPVDRNDYAALAPERITITMGG